MRKWVLFSAFLCLAYMGEVAAYIGPGSGIGLLGGLWSVLVGIFLALGAVLAWPLRILVKRFSRKSSAEAKDSEPGTG